MRTIFVNWQGCFWVFWHVFPWCCLRYKNPTIKQHPHYVTSNFTPINSLVKVQLKSAARILCFVLLRCNIPFSEQTGSFQYETNILNFRYLLLVSCIYFQEIDINTICIGKWIKIFFRKNESWQCISREVPCLLLL